MFAKRLGMRTIARSPSGFVTCNINTRARVKERVRESRERESERDKSCLPVGSYIGEKQDTNAHPYLNHVPAFHVFDSAHHIAFLFVNLHVQVVDVRADVFPSRAHLFISLQREKTEKTRAHRGGVTRARVFFCPNWNLKNLRHNFTEHRARSLTSPSTF